MSNIKIYLLGDINIIVEDEVVTEKLSSKAIALLCFLSVNKGKKFTRDKLASFFWNDVTIENARYNLRYSLWNIRKVINRGSQDIFLSTKDNCMINPDLDYYLDIHHYRDILNKYKFNDEAIESLEKAKELYRGEFLQEFYLKNCQDFNDWIFYERERCQKNHSELSYRLVALYLEKNQYEKAILILEEMLYINPFKEDVYLKLMEIYMKTNDRQAAIKQYERCEYVLRQELNIPPGEELKSLHKKLLFSNNENNKSQLSTLNNKIIVTTTEKFNSMKRKAEVWIDIPCYEVGDFKYYWLSAFVEKIIEKYSGAQLDLIASNYWCDLLRIQGMVSLIYNTLKVQETLTINSEENRIYTAFENLLCGICSMEPLTIFVEDLHYMDSTSLRYLKLFILKNHTKRVNFIVSCDINSANYKYIKDLTYTMS